MCEGGIKSPQTLPKKLNFPICAWHILDLKYFFFLDQCGTWEVHSLLRKICIHILITMLVSMHSWINYSLVFFNFICKHKLLSLVLPDSVNKILYRKYSPSLMKPSGFIVIMTLKLGGIFLPIVLGEQRVNNTSGLR